MNKFLVLKTNCQSFWGLAVLHRFYCTATLKISLHCVRLIWAFAIGFVDKDDCTIEILMNRTQFYLVQTDKLRSSLFDELAVYTNNVCSIHC